MSVKIWINRNHIYLSVYHNGKLWRESTGLTVSSDKKQNKAVMEAAELLRSKREISLVMESNSMTDPEQKKILFTDYYAEYARKRKRTVFATVARYVSEYAPKTRLCDVNAGWLEGFQQYLREAVPKATSSTFNTYEGVVRQVLKRAHKDGLVSRDPCAAVPKTKAKAAKRERLDSDDIKALLNTPYPNARYAEVKNCFFVCLYTGLRISDTANLKWGDVDFKGKSIAKRMEKTQEIVYIPLSDSAIYFLERQRNETEYVFPLVHAQKTKSGSWGYKTMEKWGLDAGVTKKITWHVARHTYATMILEQGTDIYTVSKLLGHTDIKTTAIYAQVTDKAKAKAVQTMPDINELLEK